MKQFPRTLCLLTLAALVFSITQPATAQNERLVLHASVVYEGKQPLPTLEARDFAVLIDKEPQKLVSFNHGNEPVSVGILVDISGSASRTSKDTLTYIADGIERLVRVGNPQNEYFVAAFHAKPGLVHAWTNDSQAIRGKLLALEFKGVSAFYDGLYKSIEYVKTGRHQKKVVIVLSDGQDNNSDKSFKDVREYLKESDVVLYAIGLLDYESAGSALGQEGSSILAELTKVSGGSTLMPLTDQSMSKANAINEAFEQIGTDVRSQYELVVESPQPATPRKWRKLKVTATYTDSSGKRKELKVRTREGFYR